MSEKQRKRVSTPEPEPTLLVGKSEMDQAIAKRLDLGQQLLERPVEVGDEPIWCRPPELNSLIDDFNTWDEYNQQLLASRFSTVKVANEYRHANIERYSKPHVIEKKKSARAASNASW